MKAKPCDLDLTAHALPLERFTYSPDGRSLTAFESDLRDRPFDGGYPWLRRLYSDACDVGIAVRSHHTGRIEPFCLVRTEERDGDLLAWQFGPAPGNDTGLTVTIFND